MIIVLYPVISSLLPITDVPSGTHIRHLENAKQDPFLLKYCSAFFSRLLVSGVLLDISKPPKSQEFT